MSSQRLGMEKLAFVAPLFLFVCLVGWFGLVLEGQGFSVALETALELALVDPASLELTEIHLPLPPKCCD